MQSYNYKYYIEKSDFENAEYTKLESFRWESKTPYRPRTFFKIAVINDVLTVSLKCFESSPKALYLNRDEPVYKDSCLEFFFAPIDGRSEYINIESNSKGSFLCEFGNMKPDRRYIKELTDLSPKITPFFGNDGGDDFWGVNIEVDKALLSALYRISEKDIDFGRIRANFYKCGDDCEVPHYLAFSPVTTLPPGFHNPDCFAEFILDS